KAWRRFPRSCGPSRIAASLRSLAGPPISSDMPLASTKKSLILLVITAFLCSRALFFFFHDPEGPNLLIVTVLALILYSASFIAWRFIPATAGKKILFAICAPLLIVADLYAVA